ncbi:class I SAM-dependent methyltransferase, partial [Staphylococcus warneri]|uniref:class I SAM-dependent methyltransferase n=1 Tax=Staphylococcus warneri TaxID=1292 RepID=UPI0034D987A4
MLQLPKQNTPHIHNIHLVHPHPINLPFHHPSFHYLTIPFPFTNLPHYLPPLKHIQPLLKPPPIILSLHTTQPT